MSSAIAAMRWVAMSIEVVPDSIFERSRMSLISVSRSVPERWIVSATRPAWPSRLPLAVLGELLREDQQAVQRRPQLVRHVREELRLVLRGEGELFGLLFEGSARFFELARPLSTSSFCSRKQARFLLQFLVGLLQLVLLVCSSLGERLRLLEQVFGPHVGGDRVEHDADRLGQLIEEDEVDVVEGFERAELDDGPHVALEQHRQDDDVRRLARRGPS